MTELTTGSNWVPSARKEGNAVVASLDGEIDLHNSTELRTELLDLITRNKPARLVLNLARVPYMDSAAIAVLVEAMQRMLKLGGKVFLTDLQPRVKGLIDMTRLGTVFVIARSEQEALATA